MSGQSNGQTLRPSSSPQPVTPSSSTGSTPAAADNNGESGSSNYYVPPSSSRALLKTDGESLHDTSFEGAVDEDYGAHGSLTTRSHRARNLGSFLLQPSFSPISSPNQAKISTKEAGENIKGKRKVEQGDLNIPKRRTVHQRYQTKTTVGSSPLSTEVYNAAPARAEASDDGSRREEAVSVPLRNGLDPPTHLDTYMNPQSRHGTDQSESTRDSSSALGHDTDPAQIVNLALNLSESRRRTFSAGRSASINPLGNRLLPSLNQHNSGPSNGITTAAGGGSLRQYLEQQRRVSRNISPRSSKRRDRDTPSLLSPRKAHSHTQPIAIANFDLASADEVIFNASDATLVRAEKAKVVLELDYEYRRLLQYLPPIPQPCQSKSSSGRPTTTSRIEVVQERGRLYNPLQYIRNRKVRGRQRRMLDAEGDGWKDLDRVRKWVDIVAGQREAGIWTSDDRYPLPPFESMQTDPTSEQPSLEPITSSSIDHGASKPRRKLDWSITPWDLLADAYWLHRNGNIEDIIDPNRRRIVAGKDINQEIPARISQESSRSPTRRSKSIPRQYVTPEKSSLLTSNGRNDSRERGRHQQRLRETHSPNANDNTSRDRRHRWTRGLIRSRSLSSSNESLEGNPSGDYRDSGYFVDRDLSDSAPLEKQMRELLQKEAETKALDDAGMFEKRETSTAEETEGTSTNRSSRETPNDISANSSIARTKVVQDLQPFGSSSNQIRPSFSRDEKENEEARRSLDEPILKHPTDSIAHDSEPGKPINRPGIPKQPVPSRSKTSRQNHNEEVPPVDEENIKAHSKEATNLTRHRTSNSRDDMPYKERLANFGNGLLSPLSAEAFGKRSKRADGVSTRGIKDAEPDSKARGFFKGGRIAELVGNEVQKVGDRIWKRDGHNDLSQMSSTSLNSAFEVSDVETDMGGLDSSPEDHLSRTSTYNDEPRRLPQNSNTADRSKQHTNHLHSLRFPLSRDEQSSDLPRFFLGDDHITRQQIALRARGRSSRFDRLAPPKIDIEGTSPTSSPSPMTRTQTRDTDISYNESGRSSDSQTDARNGRLDKVFDTSGIAGAGGPQGFPLSVLDSPSRRSSERLNPRGERQWSISDRGVSAVHGTVTKRETARVRALLLSSGVKANEITRRAHEVRSVPSTILQDLQKTSNRPLPRVPRSQEHILAARMLINNIETSNQQLRDAAEQFSSGTVDKLHEQIRAMDEHVTYKLTASVRAAADDADAFSVELTTTHTLAVKQLHDSVDVLLRRRRRRFRWVRRGAYVLLEWTLLGIMWWVWMIVVLIRLIRCTIGGFIGGIRWLFWM